MDGDPILDAWAQRVFLTWLARDIRFALSSLEEIRARAGLPADPLIWIPIETFLMFTSKVSKMLKPPRSGARPAHPGPKQAAFDRRDGRGAQLRALLLVQDDSPVLDRTVRDASEHFDERLDEWIELQPRPTAEQMEAGAAPDCPAPPLRKAPGPDSWTVEVAGRRIELVLVEDELQRILGRVTRLEPLAVITDSRLATLLAGLPPFPAQLALNAPTRRPDEPVSASADLAEAGAIDTRIRDAAIRLTAAFNAHDQHRES